MNRLQQLDPSETTGKVQTLLAGVEKKLGKVPNLFRVLSNAPAVLEGYLNFSGALANGTFSPRVREQISLAVAESNLCEYCLSAHTYFAGKVGLNEKDIVDARHATAATDKTDAILKLARTIVVQRGELSDATLQTARASGLNDGEIVETIANVAINIFTNYVNHIARTVVDFPAVKPGQVEATVQTDGCSGDCGCQH